jgi:ribosomal 50S subunit-recycling heat shock protein
VRVDLYLKLMGITKTRMVAKRLCDSGKVLLNSHPVKPAQEVLEGGVLEVFFPQREVRFRILAIPPAPSVAKKDRPQFMALESVKELSRDSSSFELFHPAESNPEDD